MINPLWKFIDFNFDITVFMENFNFRLIYDRKLITIGRLAWDMLVGVMPLELVSAMVSWLVVTNVVVQPEVGWRSVPCPDGGPRNYMYNTLPPQIVMGCLVNHTESYPLEHPSYRDVITTVYRHQIVSVEGMGRWTNKTEVVSTTSVRERPIVKWEVVTNEEVKIGRINYTNLITTNVIQFKIYP